MKFKRFDKRLITLIALGLATLLGLSYIAIAETDTASLSVTVTSTAAVDINPASFTWTTSDISGAGVTSATKNFQIEDIGSSAITNIYASTTHESSNAYGSGSYSNYNAGDFLLIDNTTSGTLYYVDKREYNESVPAYVTAPTSYVSFFRLRTVNFNGSTNGEEYFAFLVNGTSNCSTGQVLVAKTLHNQTQTGTTDFSGSGTDYNTVTLSSNAGSTSAVNTLFNAHTLYVPNACTYIDILYWNQPNSGHYLVPWSMNPGNATDMRMEVKVPYGVSSGGAITGTLTITAT